MTESTEPAATWKKKKKQQPEEFKLKRPAKLIATKSIEKREREMKKKPTNNAFDPENNSLGIGAC